MPPQHLRRPLRLQMPTKTPRWQMRPRRPRAPRTRRCRLPPRPPMRCCRPPSHPRAKPSTFREAKADMRYNTMKTYRGCGLLPWLLVAMSLLLARPVRVLAADTPREEAITLNAGETSVIDNLNPEVKPAVKVITNPHALVTHNEDPTKLVLLGAEAGKWEITV